MAPKGFKEFPRVVYGPNGAQETITKEDDRPEGYVNDFKQAQKLDAEDGWKKGKKKASGGQRKQTTQAAKEDAEKKKAEAEEAEKEQLQAYLDEHKVVYEKDLDLDKLRALSDELTKHLENQATKAQQEAGNGNGA